MRVTFREFVKDARWSDCLFEVEAAPSIGAAPEAPDNPEKTTNKYHFDALQRQLGIDDDGLTAALEGDTIQFWKVPDYSSQWGFLVSGPTSATVSQRPDGSFDVTFHLKEKQLLNPKNFIKPYKQGQRPINYQGPVEDKTVTMSREELQDAMTLPLASGGGSPMGAPGAAPIGAPMGAPPMGGM